MNFWNTLANDATDGICSGHNQMQQIRCTKAGSSAKLVQRWCGSDGPTSTCSTCYCDAARSFRTDFEKRGWMKHGARNIGKDLILVWILNDWWSEVSMFMILKCDLGVWRGEGGLPLIPSSRHGLDGLWQWGHKELWFLGGEFARSARGNAPQRLCGSVCIDLFPWSFSYFLRLWSKKFILEDLHALSKDQCDCHGLQLIVSRQALGDENTSVCSQRWPTSPVVSCQLMLDWGHKAHGAFLNIVHFSQHHAVAGVANCAAKFEAHLGSFVENLTPSNHFSWEVQNLCLRENRRGN